MSDVQLVAECLFLLFQNGNEIDKSANLLDEFLQYPHKEYVINYEDEWQEKGLPPQPYYVALAFSLCKWHSSSSLDYLNMNNFKGLNVDNLVTESLELHLPTLQECFRSHWPPVDSVSTVKIAWKLFVKGMSERHLLTLVRMRSTIGSLNRLPPSRIVLLKSFEQPHSSKPNVKLTTGAKALSKHAHRASDGFWGDMRGNDTKKNEEALEMVEKIMDNAVWINIHLLPHGLHILEIRIYEGYGARWEAHGNKFRGFLEPQMEGGHEKKWRH